MSAQNQTDRILLARLAGKRKWAVIEEKRPDYAEKAMSTLLFNQANKYVERENCGVRYRMIRRSQCAEYGVPEDSPGMPRALLHKE